MAIITTSQNITSVSYVAGEILDIRNGATLTISASPATRPGTIQCITSGKLRIENSSTTVPLVLELEDMNRDLRFESNGILEVAGAMMELGTGTGSAQTFDFTSLYSGALTDITYIEVEETAGSGNYYPWHIVEIASRYYNIGRVTDRGSQTADFDGFQEVFFWNSDTRVLTTGNGTNGKSVPSGCKIRIPNVLITNRDWSPDVSLIHRIVSEGVPTGGTFTITVINRRTGSTLGTTGAIAFNASAATIDTAIEAVTGAGTITASGGPLPTAVSITLAGAFASTPLALQVNSSVTGGTNPIIYSLENAAANMSLLDLNPSGTVTASSCMFSRKIRQLHTAYANISYTRTGLGGDAIQLSSSTGAVTLDHVSYTPNPYTIQAQNFLINTVFGNVNIKKTTVTQSSCQTTCSINVAPNMQTCEDVRVMGYGVRTSTAGVLMSYATLPANLTILRPRTVGGRTVFTNLTGCSVVSPRISDSVGSTQLTTNAVSAMTPTNCIDMVISDIQKFGTAAHRNSIVVPDAASSNIKVVGGSYDGSGNLSGPLAPSGSTTTLLNFTTTNCRSGGILIDLPAAFTATNTIIRKAFNTLSSGNSTVDSGQGNYYDIVGCSILDFNEVNTSVNDWVGGNFADYGTTPTTGHVTFGAFGSGTGMTTTGSAYTSQTGNVTMPSNGDTFIAQIPFAMHAITSFQNQPQQFVCQGAGVFANLHTIINEGGITGGTFTISVFDSSNTLLGTTAALAFNATTTVVDTALEGISGVGTGVTVSGALSTGYLITMPTGFVGRLSVDGSLLTGGTEPGVAYAFGRATPSTTINNMGTGYTFDFQVRNGGETTWPASWTSLSGANLSTAIAGLTSYNANTTGLEMRIRVTANGADPYRNISQISCLTNIDPASWTVTDSTITFNGPNPTDIVKIKRASDMTVLYTFTGSGTKDFSLGSNFNTAVYFAREDSGGNLLMRSDPFMINLKFGDNGTVNLFYGDEVQLAQSSTVTAIASTLTGIESDLNIINQGVQKASILVPHTTNLS